MPGYYRWIHHGEADRIREEVVRPCLEAFDDDAEVADMLDNAHQAQFAGGRDKVDMEANANTTRNPLICDEFSVTNFEIVTVVALSLAILRSNLVDIQPMARHQLVYINQPQNLIPALLPTVTSRHPNISHAHPTPAGGLHSHPAAPPSIPVAGLPTMSSTQPPDHQFLPASLSCRVSHRRPLAKSFLSPSIALRLAAAADDQSPCSPDAVTSASCADARSWIESDPTIFL